MRRLTVASIVFAATVGAIVWSVSAFIMRDLSESYVSRVITQAKGKAEAVARMVNDPSTLADGEMKESMPRDGAMDPDVLLPGPQIFDDQGEPIEPVESLEFFRRSGPEVAASIPLGAGSSSQRLPGVLEMQGQELQTKVNGELVRRDAIRLIRIRYAGGYQVIRFHQMDRRFLDPAVERDPNATWEYIPVEYRPSSRPVMVAWEAQLDGQPVQLEAAIDASVLDEGIAQLRQQIVPKVAVGGAVFVLLLVGAYLYVLKLMREARCLEAEANEQAVLAQVGMLAAGLAHEIRNPLSAMRMNLQLLEEEMSPAVASPALAVASGGGGHRAFARAGGESGRQTTGAQDLAMHERLLHGTQREILRLNALVTNFLTFARPPEPHRSPHVVDVVVKDCVDLLRPMAVGVGVTLETDFGAGGQPVLLDEALVKQALMNVILNAVQAVQTASPPGGGRVRITTRRTSRDVEIEVSDDGSGIPSDPEPLFRVFYSTKKGGSGLGLAISRAIAERHGGRLEARNASATGSPQGGAVFTLSLPALDAAE